MMAECHCAGPTGARLRTRNRPWARHREMPDALLLGDLLQSLDELEVVAHVLTSAVRRSSTWIQDIDMCTSLEKRARRWRTSPSGRLLISPVRNPRPRGEYARIAMPSSVQVAMTTYQMSFRPGTNKSKQRLTLLGLFPIAAHPSRKRQRN